MGPGRSQRRELSCCSSMVPRERQLSKALLVLHTRSRPVENSTIAYLLAAKLQNHLPQRLRAFPHRLNFHILFRAVKAASGGAEDNARNARICKQGCICPRRHASQLARAANVGDDFACALHEWGIFANLICRTRAQSFAERRAKFRILLFEAREHFAQFRFRALLRFPRQHAPFELQSALRRKAPARPRSTTRVATHFPAAHAARAKRAAFPTRRAPPARAPSCRLRRVPRRANCHAPRARASQFQTTRSPYAR